MDFKATKKKLKETKYQLEIEFSQKVMAEFEKEALKKLAKTLELKGFRKGKVPVAMAEKHLSKEKVTQQALGLALPEVYARAVQETKLRPIGPPEIKIKEFKPKKPILLEALVEVLPKIELPDFKKIKIKRESTKLTEQELKQGLENLQKRLAEYTDKKSPAKKGDWVEIDFEGSVRGAKIEQLSSQTHPFVLGEGGFIKGFEEQIKGMKKGEEKEFKLSLPKNHPQKMLADKKVDFKLKLNKVKKVKLSSLKELAKKLGAKSEADFKKRFKKAQEAQKKETVDKKFEQRLVAEVIDKAKLELPKGLISQEYQRISEQHKKDLAAQKMTIEDYLERFKIDQKELEKNLNETAKQNVKVALVMAEISQQEKIEPTEKEIKAKTNQLITEGMMQGGKKPELREHYQSEQGQTFITNVIRNEKTLKRLKGLVAKS